MVASLYSVLFPLVLEKKTGILYINHEFSEWSRIFLTKGRIGGIEDADTEGVVAGKRIAQKISISTEFKESNLHSAQHLDGINTAKYLSVLARVEKVTEDIRKVIPGNDAIFKTIASKWQGENINSSELKVVISLDGRHTVGQIILELGLTELQVIHAIYNFYNRGLVKTVTTHRPMSSKKRRIFLNSLSRTLSDIVGPASDVIITEAFDSMEVSPQYLAIPMIPKLLNKISSYLDKGEKEILKRWSGQFISLINEHHKQNGMRHYS